MDLLRSLPIGLYLEQPQTWLHRLDSRVKLGWLMTFLLTPILANNTIRISLVILLIIITLIGQIPARAWRQQMLNLLLFSSLIMLLTIIFPDGLPNHHNPRLPINELVFINPPTKNPSLEKPKELPQPTPYKYIIYKIGVIEVTRRKLDLGTRISTLLFTVIYSTSLYLLTTAPEEITTGLENLLQPFKKYKLPVTEIVLTLTLSLRFIPLVLEEIQNLVRAVWTRAIKWNKLGIKGSIKLWLTIAERILENLLLRSEQIAAAMSVRGFTTPNEHKVNWYQLNLKTTDWLALLGLILLWVGRLIWGWE